MTICVTAMTTNVHGFPWHSKMSYGLSIFLKTPHNLPPINLFRIFVIYVSRAIILILSTYRDVFLALSIPVDNLQQRLHHATRHEGFSACNNNTVNIHTATTTQSTFTLQQHIETFTMQQHIQSTFTGSHEKLHSLELCEIS